MSFSWQIYPDCIVIEGQKSCAALISPHIVNELSRCALYFGKLKYLKCKEERWLLELLYIEE